MGICLNCQPTVSMLSDVLRVKNQPSWYDIKRCEAEGLRANVIITLNGEDVTNDCFEMLLGPRGYVLVYSVNDEGKRHFCDNHPGPRRHMIHDGVHYVEMEHGVAVEIRHGHVEMRRKTEVGSEDGSDQVPENNPSALVSEGH